MRRKKILQEHIQMMRETLASIFSSTTKKKILQEHIQMMLYTLLAFIVGYLAAAVALSWAWGILP